MNAATGRERNVDPSESVFVVLLFKVRKPVEVVRQHGLAVLITHNSIILWRWRDQRRRRFEIFKRRRRKRGRAYQMHGTSFALAVALGGLVGNVSLLRPCQTT
jgi:hypothetical protein